MRSSRLKGDVTLAAFMSDQTAEPPPAKQPLPSDEAIKKLKERISRLKKRNPPSVAGPERNDIDAEVDEKAARLGRGQGPNPTDYDNSHLQRGSVSGAFNLNLRNPQANSVSRVCEDLVRSGFFRRGDDAAASAACRSRFQR